MRQLTLRYAVLAAALMGAALSPAFAQDKAGKGEGTPGKLTPFKWDKAAQLKKGEQAAGPRGAAAAGDELVCEKGVVYPTPAPTDMKPGAVPNLADMGRQHCWRKSDPSRIIERPVGMLDPMMEGIQDSMKNSFPPLKAKPRKPRAGKKPAKSASGPAPKGTAPAGGVAVKGTSPILLRDAR